MAQSRGVAPLVVAQAAALNRVAATLTPVVTRLVRDFQGWYSTAQITRWAAELAAVAESGQRTTAATTDAYLTRALAEMTGKPVRPSGAVNVAGLRRNVTHPGAYGRLADQFRFEVSQGADEVTALEHVVQRAEVVADTDLMLAQRAQERHFMVVRSVDGWRRVIHPEVSRGGVCGLCVAAADRVYKRGDLRPIHARCVPGGTKVVARGVSAVTRRDYPGPLVLLSTASGEQLTITANHPVLTDQGWVPAGFVDVGSKVVRRMFRERAIDGGPEEGQRPTTVEQVWRAATVDHGLHPRAVPLAAEDFHGDGSHGEVDVVATRGLLAHVPDVTFLEPSSDAGLVAGHRAGVALDCEGPLLESFFGLWDSTDGVVSGARDPLALLTRHAAHAVDAGFSAISMPSPVLRYPPVDDLTRDPQVRRDGQHSLPGFVPAHDLAVREAQPDASRFDPAFSEFAGDGRHAYAQLGRDLLQRLAGQVELDCVVDKRWVEGPHVVYNLSTQDGWYAADNVIVSNCACTVLPIVNGQDPAADLNRADLDNLYRAAGGDTSAAALKKVRVTVHDHGELGPVLAERGAKFRTQRNARADLRAS